MRLYSRLLAPTEHSLCESVRACPVQSFKLCAKAACEERYDVNKSIHTLNFSSFRSLFGSILVVGNDLMLFARIEFV